MREALEAFLFTYHTTIYTSLFFGTIGAVALWENAAPRRELLTSLRTRWLNNFGIMFVNTSIVWIVFPGFGIGAALITAEQDWGLLRLVSAPYWVAFVVSIILMDLTRYAEHFLLHHVPIFWRIHRMHHTDLDFDVTTAVRFHPAEAIGVIGIKVATVAVLGAPIAAVLLYELAYPMTTFWVHGNLRMPKG